MQVTVTVCNVCQQIDAPTQQYEIRQGQRRKKVDLCEAHSQTIEALLQLPNSGSATKKTASSGSRRRNRVTTLEEIEAQKKKTPTK
jgi:hypothetical protein